MITTIILIVIGLATGVVLYLAHKGAESRINAIREHYNLYYQKTEKEKAILKEQIETYKKLVESGNQAIKIKSEKIDKLNQRLK